MKNNSEARVCKNIKCQKVLPEGYKHRYCEACRNLHANNAKKALKIGTAVVTSAFAIVLSWKKK